MYSLFLNGYDTFGQLLFLKWTRDLRQKFKLLALGTKKSTEFISAFFDLVGRSGIEPLASTV